MLVAPAASADKRAEDGKKGTGEDADNRTIVPPRPRILIEQGGCINSRRVSTEFLSAEYTVNGGLKRGIRQCRASTDLGLGQPAARRRSTGAEDYARYQRSRW